MRSKKEGEGRRDGAVARSGRGGENKERVRRGGEEEERRWRG